MTNLEHELRKLHDEVSAVDGCSDFYGPHTGSDCGTLRALRAAAAVAYEDAACIAEAGVPGSFVDKTGKTVSAIVTNPGIAAAIRSRAGQ